MISFVAGHCAELHEVPDNSTDLSPNPSVITLVFSCPATGGAVPGTQQGCPLGRGERLMIRRWFFKQQGIARDQTGFRLFVKQIPKVLIPLIRGGSPGRSRITPEGIGRDFCQQVLDLSFVQPVANLNLGTEQNGPVLREQGGRQEEQQASVQHRVQDSSGWAGAPLRQQSGHQHIRVHHHQIEQPMRGFLNHWFAKREYLNHLRKGESRERYLIQYRELETLHIAHQ